MVTQGGFRFATGFRVTFNLGMPGFEAPHQCLCYLQRRFIVNGEAWELVAVSRRIAIMLGAHVSFLLPLGGRTSQVNRRVNRKQPQLGVPVPQAHPKSGQLFLPVLGIATYGQPELELELYIVLVNRTKGPVGLFNCTTQRITSFQYTDEIEFISQDNFRE